MAAGTACDQAPCLRHLRLPRDAWWQLAVPLPPAAPHLCRNPGLTTAPPLPPALPPTLHLLQEIFVLVRHRLRQLGCRLHLRVVPQLHGRAAPETTAGQGARGAGDDRRLLLQLAQRQQAGLGLGTAPVKLRAPASDPQAPHLHVSRQVLRVCCGAGAADVHAIGQRCNLVRHAVGHVCAQRAAAHRQW